MPGAIVEDVYCVEEFANFLESESEGFHALYLLDAGNVVVGVKPEAAGCVVGGVTSPQSS